MSIRNSKFKTNPADYCTTEPKKTWPFIQDNLSELAKDQ